MGLGVLVAAHKRLLAGEPPGALRLVYTNQRILKLLRITGLLGLFPLHATVEQARAVGGHHPARSSGNG
jgi:anti-sigma B factor antagonist